MPDKQCHILDVVVLPGELEEDAEKLFTCDTITRNNLGKVSFKAIQPTQVLLLNVPMELQ